MTFQELINNGWNDHAKDPQGVAQRLAESLELVQEEEQLSAYTSLLTHVYGGHLGQWAEGIQLLKKLGERFDHEAISRCQAVLAYCSGDEKLYQASQAKVRILAQAASELLGQKEVSRAAAAFELALELAGDNLTKDDPIARSLAISGNNLACELEEKKDRNFEEEDLMETTANAARKYWEIAGGWLEVERAEYRLAMTYLQSGKIDRALAHAELCLKICQENKAEAFELFFAHEALAKVWKVEGNQKLFEAEIEKCVKYREEVKEDWQQYCVIPKKVP